MITIFIRTILLYILVVIAIRVMGKSELSQLQPYELVVIIMIAELASVPMENVSIPFINGTVAIFTLVLLQITVSIITLKSEKARSIICGKPTILIERGRIIEKELKKLRINMNDLIEQLRIKDIAKIDDVEFAILETNGELSIIPKAANRPLTPSDMNLNVQQEELPISIIIDGKVNYENLKRASLDFDWLYDQLQRSNIREFNDVLYGYIDQNKKLHIHKKYEDLEE